MQASVDTPQTPSTELMPRDEAEPSACDAEPMPGESQADGWKSQSEAHDAELIPSDESLQRRRRRLEVDQLTLDEEELQVKRMRLDLERQELQTAMKRLKMHAIARARRRRPKSMPSRLCVLLQSRPFSAGRPALNSSTG